VGKLLLRQFDLTFKLLDLDYKLSDNILAPLPGNTESIFLNDKPLVSLASEVLSYKLTWRLHYILFPLFFGSFRETIWRLHKPKGGSITLL
jgi:hypothetical protein